LTGEILPAQNSTIQVTPVKSLQITIITVFLGLAFLMYEVTDNYNAYHDLGASHMDSGSIVFVQAPGNKSTGKILYNVKKFAFVPPDFIALALNTPEMIASRPLIPLNDLLPSRASPA
jgi:hypothetical protein